MKNEFARYTGVGGIAFIADFTLLTLLASIGLHYLLATLMAFLIGSWVNYQLSIRWAFRYRALESNKVEFGVFLLIGAVSLGVGISLIVLMVAGLGWHLLVAKCVATAITLVLNFTCKKFILFTRSNQVEIASSSVAR